METFWGVSSQIKGNGKWEESVRKEGRGINGDDLREREREKGR